MAICSRSLSKYCIWQDETNLTFSLATCRTSQIASSTIHVIPFFAFLQVDTRSGTLVTAVRSSNLFLLGDAPLWTSGAVDARVMDPLFADEICDIRSLHVGWLMLQMNWLSRAFNISEQWNCCTLATSVNGRD